ncbi:hydroxyisourate hydrolase [Chamaesiphon minutus]|uniref:5-hydroxyisourate hydrolase n=1 Tax=Chamaesiphon minutus (strain ATCC 27169 / PCC 6605) TaxID=1173020 RepID=K9UD45_CHAP6|nr:hydroxyisourate hydrolase [Chamaesiphon minutus]AFY92134.1 hydroxyisourate hydrolase [Chamaesiphon minutus PCC 6605]
MAGKLTTHVLDTAHGCPAPGIEICLYSIESPADNRTLIKQVYTDRDGRTDKPLLADGELQIGEYELVFSIGSYFEKIQSDLPNPAFLDRIPIRFQIANHEVHYHIPLLVSPWSYSTYRGS